MKSERNNQSGAERFFLGLIYFLVLSLGTISAETEKQVEGGAKSEKMNILVILTDDQGYAAVSNNPLHPKWVSTPNIDSIAKKGVEFTQAYCGGNVCSVSRTALLTGRYPQQAGVYTGGEGGKGIAMDNKIIPTFLKQAGYHSGAFGKWHLGTEIEQGPIKRGFDESLGFLGRGAHDYVKLSDPADPIYRGLEPVNMTGYLTNILTDEAVSFITKNKTKPFFCYLAYNAVHTPIQAPPEGDAKFADAKAIDPKYQDDTKGPIKTYLAMLENLDQGIGRVLESLKKEGIEEKTIVIFCTDNGGPFDPEQFNKPLHGNKHENWEGGVRTPFYIYWPGHTKAGTTIPAMVSHFDILPTLLEITGVPLPTDKPLDGKSIVPLITGEATKIHDKLFWSGGSDEPWWSTRQGDWKMLGYKADLKLFNLAEDPGEMKDLAKSNPEKLEELRASYNQWLASMADPMKSENKKVWTPDTGGGKKDKKDKKKDKTKEE